MTTELDRLNKLLDDSHALSYQGFLRLAAALMSAGEYMWPEKWGRDFKVVKETYRKESLILDGHLHLCLPTTDVLFKEE